MGHAPRIEAELDHAARERRGDIEAAARARLEPPVELDRLRERRPRQPRPGGPRAGERDERGRARAEAELRACDVEIRRVERRPPCRALAAEHAADENDERDAGIAAE